MEETVVRTLLVLVGMVIGLLLMIFPRVVARRIVRDNNRLLGLNYGEREVKITAFVAFVSGAFLFVNGILRFLGVG